MRLPGTIAWPMKPGRVEELTRFVQPVGDRPLSYPLDFVERQLPKLGDDVRQQNDSEDDWGSTTAASPASGLNVTPEAELLSKIRTGDHWHDNMVRLVAHLVGSGVSDNIILALADALTLQGWTVDQTRADMRKMIDGARQKWTRPDPQPGVTVPEKLPDPVDIFFNANSPTPELKSKHVPLALWPYIVDTADRMGVDPTSVAVSCLVTAASAISDDWRLQPRMHDTEYTEQARLWGAIVGPPSILKTPVISAVTRPVDYLETMARTQHRADMAEHEELLAKWKKEDGPKPAPPKLPRYLVEDTTIEALSDVLRDDEKSTMQCPARKVLVRQDEMSEFFANLDRYSGGKGSGDRGAYLRLYNGGRWTNDRVGRGHFAVSNWSACFLGGIQPGPIQQIASRSTEDGLLQRFIFVVPGPQKPGIDRAPDRSAIDRYERLIPAVLALKPRHSILGRVDNVVLHADAHRHREAVGALWRAMSALPDTSARMANSLGKWSGLFARLCLTYHLIELATAGQAAPHPQVVSEDTARRVSDFIREILLPHLYRADRLMFLTPMTSDAQWIAGHILERKLDRISIRDVARAYHRFRTPESRRDIEIVMAGLVVCGWLEPEPTPTPTMKPPHRWLVNPAVHTKFAVRAEEERKARETGREAVQKAFALRQAMMQEADADPDAANEPVPDDDID